MRGGGRRAVFLDRDGTLIVDRHYLKRASDVLLLPAVPEALRLLQDEGFALVVVSNQSGVARGLMSEEDVDAANQRLRDLLEEQGIRLDAVYYCPHLEGGAIARYASDCDCRKPRPGLLRRAGDELGLELDGSWVVGDKAADLWLGAELGLRSLLVRTGHGRETEAGSDLGPALAVLDDLLGAAHWILSRTGEAI